MLLNLKFFKQIYVEKKNAWLCTLIIQNILLTTIKLLILHKIFKNCKYTNSCNHKY